MEAKEAPEGMLMAISEVFLGPWESNESGTSNAIKYSGGTVLNSIYANEVDRKLTERASGLSCLRSHGNWIELAPSIQQQELQRSCRMLETRRLVVGNMTPYNWRPMSDRSTSGGALVPGD
ncbi:hypothetical protein Taro_023209 [Colocasia esculenta]|uniref:Uncharacterized protein n=1 Tax=Colocasia esculenta TaxID=4460 RepID=A0A843V3K2_COLES|nr:hypothetical protein [Colocasia esculenta]